VPRTKQPIPPVDFADVQDVMARFEEHGYLADHKLATTVFLQTRLDKPVLLEGPAGVGKTQLALSLAQVTGRKLLRLQCYEGQDETKALYEWDYGKQLLYTQILRSTIDEVIAGAKNIDEAVERIGAQESVFFSERFLASRPLLEAVRSTEPVVLLVDEVDRADEALEAVLLELLAEYQVSIPEVGTFKAIHKPYVVLTSNNTRDLSAALKRRCLHLSLDYPDADRELAIIRSKNTGLPDALAQQLVTIVRGLRELELRKAPSISETIDWARTLAVLGVQDLTAEVLSNTANVVVKYERDLRRTTEALPRLVDPNASLGAAKGHDHEHEHGHGHGAGGDHDHGKNHDHTPSGASKAALADGDVDGRAVRKAMDLPGRHGPGVYGSPQSPPAHAGTGMRAAAPGQKKRPAARGTRKRPV
jgi:MoxR-like ATPase